LPEFLPKGPQVAPLENLTPAAYNRQSNLEVAVSAHASDNHHDSARGKKPRL
jgi:hypothetical protein